MTTRKKSQKKPKKTSKDPSVVTKIGTKPKREKFQFDPSAYEHLSEDTPMEIWIAEFFCRDEGFMQEYSLFKSSFPSLGGEGADDLNAVFKHPSEECHWSPSSSRKLSNGESFDVILHQPVTAETFSDDIDYLMSLAKELEPLMPQNWSDEAQATPGKKRVKPLKERYIDWIRADALYSCSLTPGPPDDEISVQALLHRLRLKDKHEEWIPGSRMVITVNLDRKTSEIQDALKKLIGIHKKKRGAERLGKTMAKWKYYLIVYDLRLKKIPYKEKFKIFAEHYPHVDELDDDNPNVSAEQNLKNYRKAAKKLIGGGYRKYI